MKYPTELKYTKDHEWAKKDGNVVTIGITHHAQSALGDVVFCELPQVGRMLKPGETFGVVESIKAVSDLYAPISGKVLKTNTGVVEQPALINSNPHDEAWMIQIEMVAPQEWDALMDASTYEKWVQSQK